MKSSVLFYVAGVQFRPAEDIDRALAQGLRVGSPVVLKAEPANKYDKNAIAVISGGIPIGYVPKHKQAETRGAVEGTIVECHEDGPPWERFLVSLNPALSGLSDDVPYTEPAEPQPRPQPEATELEIVAPSYAIDRITATVEAQKHRDELLGQARSVAGIPDAAAAQSAAALLHEITAFTRTIEATREEVKRPLLEAGRKIDATAKGLVLDLTEDAKRLGNLLGGYQAAQKKIEEDNRRRAYEEQERIRRETEDKERRIREDREADRRKLNEVRNQFVAAVDPAHAPGDYADLTVEQFAETIKEIKAARIARKEAEAAALKAKSEKAKAAAAEKAEAVRIAAEKAQRDAAERAETARKEREARETAEEQARWNEAALKSAKAAEVVVAPPTKLHGLAVGSEIKFEVTDVVALYEAAPYLVKLEPNTSSIKAALKQLPAGQSLPGVRHWKEAKTTVRQ